MSDPREAARERLIDTGGTALARVATPGLTERLSDGRLGVALDADAVAAVVVDAVLASDDVLIAKGGERTGYEMLRARLVTGSLSPSDPVWVFPSSVPNKEGEE